MTRLRPAALLVALVAAGAGCGGEAPARDPGAVERVTIPAGASFGQVTDSLVARGVVTNRQWFKLVARMRRVDRAVRAGVFEFPRGAAPTEILDVLARGAEVSARITVPEGLPIPDVAELAEARLGIPADSFVAAARDSAFATRLGIPAATFEGFLRPETYLVPVQLDARGLVRIMAEGFKAAWDSSWTRRLDTLGMTQLELVTLASIVEGEARVDDERETIAGVYHNRLRRGMPLQADPTVQYAIYLRTGERKPRLFEKDYLVESPYNTYRIPGLPPGPVSSPSRRSIEASLYPKDVPYYFFVAGPDGRHVFTATYAEHLRTIRRLRGR